MSRRSRFAVSNLAPATVQQAIAHVELAPESAPALAVVPPEEPMPEVVAAPVEPVEAPPPPKPRVYTCLACGLIPGAPGYCRSCTSQARVNANPRILNAMLAPPGVPESAWHAAIGALLERRPPKSGPSAVMQLLDLRLPELRACIAAAFKAVP